MTHLQPLDKIETGMFIDWMIAKGRLHRVQPNDPPPDMVVRNCKWFVCDAERDEMLEWVGNEMLKNSEPAK